MLLRAGAPGVPALKDSLESVAEIFKRPAEATPHRPWRAFGDAVVFSTLFRRRLLTFLNLPGAAHEQLHFRPVTRDPLRPGRIASREPSDQRRRLVAAGGRLLVAGLAAIVPGSPARAHHGFAGKHDFLRPLYLAGRLTDAYIGYPHARLTLDVPRNLQLPRDREWIRALEDAEARQTTTLLRASESRGIVVISLDRRLTRRLMEEPEALRPGDPVEAVVYRRTTRDEYRNELHAVLVALPDGRLLVSSSPSVRSP